MIYRERPNDPGDVSEIIDLELLGTNRLQVIVLTNDPRLLAGMSSMEPIRQALKVNSTSWCR
ncbi:hypothetical protein V5O39_10310 [Pseudomonas parakoreensis]